DVLLLALDRERVREADETELGHRVVRLAEVAVDARGARGEDDAAVAGLLHVIPRGLRDPEAAEHVHAVDEVPVLLRQLLEGGVAEDARVVDDDVDPLPRVERGLDDLVAVLDRVVVGDRLAAGGLDLLDDLVGRRARFASAGRAAAEVVDHDLAAARGEQERMGATETVASARHDGDAPIKTQIGHGESSVWASRPGPRP